MIRRLVSKDLLKPPNKIIYEHSPRNVLQDCAWIASGIRGQKMAQANGRRVEEDESQWFGICDCKSIQT